MLRLGFALVLFAACSDDTAAPKDGGVIDLATTDIDNGSCGNQVRFTGEYVDWDNDAAFCGIFEALFQVQGDGAMDTTAPNGRFDLCIPDQATTIIDITPPTEPSQCAAQVSPYTMPGLAVARRDVIFAQGGFWSGRGITDAKKAELGLEAGKAHVLVHVAGTPRPVAIAAAHGPTQAVVDRTWAPGDTGHEVFFPNVDVGAGSTMLSVSGGTTAGTGSIPLAAGTVTNITIVVN